MRLWLDDERDPEEWLPGMPWMRGRPPADFKGWIWARTAKEALEILATREVIEASLDHDLGPEDEVGTGYQVVNKLDELTFLDPTFPIPVVHVHSSNAGARDRMELAVRALERRAAERAPEETGKETDKMTETCRNGHPRVKPDGTSNVYVYPPRVGRKARITCRTCRDGEHVDRPPQEERVAAFAEREVAKVVPKKFNEYGELKFWGLCRAIIAERYPLRMAWLMTQMRPELVDDVRKAADLLERGVYVFDAHDGDPDKIRQTADRPSKTKGVNNDQA